MCNLNTSYMKSKCYCADFTQWHLPTGPWVRGLVYTDSKKFRWMRQLTAGTMLSQTEGWYMQMHALWNMYKLILTRIPESPGRKDQLLKLPLPQFWHWWWPWVPGSASCSHDREHKAHASTKHSQNKVFPFRLIITHPAFCTQLWMWTHSRDFCKHLICPINGVEGLDNREFAEMRTPIQNCSFSDSIYWRIMTRSVRKFVRT